MARVMLKTPTEKPLASSVGREVWSAGPGSFPIRVFLRSGRYSVQYGQQLDHDLDYGQATKALGEAILHRRLLDVLEV